MNTTVFLLIIILAFVLLSIINDKTRKYKETDIRYRFDRSGRVVRVEYFLWQKNKKKFIEDTFTEDRLVASPLGYQFKIVEYLGDFKQFSLSISREKQFSVIPSVKNTEIDQD